MNNLDPEVAENSRELVVYGGINHAARNWGHYDRIIKTPKRPNDSGTPLVQFGKPVGVFKTHTNTSRVPIASSSLMPHWATWEHFNGLSAEGLTVYSQIAVDS